MRVGIVGSGFGGAVHAPAFKAQGRFDVVAIASPNAAAEVAKARGIPQAFASLDEMLAACELDVVSIASPPFAHREQVLRALSAGKHVLCEKPFGLSVAEAQEMTAAAESAGTVCAIAHEFRYMPSRRALRELIENDHLGALRQIEFALMLGNLRAEVERKPSWWFERARGGGATGAYLSHLIDHANWLAGSAPIRATGLSRTANAQRSFEGTPFASDVADGAFALLEYAGGLVARVSVDATCAVESATLAVHGETRTAVASGPTITECALFVVDDDETAELTLRADPHARLSAVHGNLPAFTGLLDAFADAIDGKPADLPTFAQGLATQRVLEAVGYSV